MSNKESNLNEKNWSKFSHLLTVRAEVADLPPPFTVSLTIKYPCFLRLPLSHKLSVSAQVWWRSQWLGFSERETHDWRSQLGISTGLESNRSGTLIQLVQTQGTVFLRRSIHFSDAPEFLRCSTKIDPTTVDLSDAVIISQMLRENVLEWLTYLYHSHQFYILYGMGDSSRWSASD